jgi:RNA polymerase sigma-70 factor (ECF subfamily)
MIRTPHDDVVGRFAEACRLGDLAQIWDTLDTGAAATCDGGGVVPALGPFYGAEDVAQFAAALLRGRPGTDLTVESVNGRAGLALRRAGRALAVVAIETAGAGVTALWVVLNPAKLNGWHTAQALAG